MPAKHLQPGPTRGSSSSSAPRGGCGTAGGAAQPCIQDLDQRAQAELKGVLAGSRAVGAAGPQDMGDT